jgi:predicted SnoaL-like aldol condensation-catalyzing enzyme
MTLKRLAAPILTALLVAGGAATASSHSTPTTHEGAAPMTPTELVLAGFAALFTDFDVEALPDLFAEDYIQHNPGVPTGLAPVMGVLPAIEASGLRVTTHRVFADGDLVVLHSTYENAEFFGAPTLVGFDVFRVADGKIVEHWDNLQPPAAPNASGRTMTDGPTEVTDLDRTEANKARVAEFAQAVLIEGDFARITDFIVGGEAYAQHNPLFGDGLTALGAAFEELAQQGNAIRYTTVHRVLGEGNFVLMMAEGTFGATPTAYYDLFRLEDGMIVEHWDVIQEIPEEMAHSNGKF